mgnify:CR=1 FL=1
MNAGAAGAVRETVPVIQTTVAAVREDEESVGTVKSDTVDISGQGKDLSVSSAGLLASKLFEGIDTSDGISLNELEGLLRKKSAVLKEDLDSLFERTGIDNTDEICLTVGYDGSVLVNGEHPDKAAIEKLFADDPGLSNRFREVSGLAEIIRAGQEGVEFQKAYAQDPIAAVEQFSYLFSGNYQPQFNLSWSADSMSFFFTDLFHPGRQYLDF